jgi:hypothetical protein
VSFHPTIITFKCPTASATIYIIPCILHFGVQLALEHERVALAGRPSAPEAITIVWMSLFCRPDLALIVEYPFRENVLAPLHLANSTLRGKENQTTERGERSS